MRAYYRIMLGQNSIYAEEAHVGNFIGVGWIKKTDLSNKLPENWREFNKVMIPKYLKENPGRSRVAAGLACGMLWTIAKGINVDDIVLCPNGRAEYMVGEITTNYEYQKGEKLPHRRGVRWFPGVIERNQMSEALQNSTGAAGTAINISGYAEEIEKLISGKKPADIIATDETIEDPSVFALEQYLEDFLVQNWEHTILGKKYNIFKEKGEIIGKQYQTDTGPLDILAISKDKKELLVIELKRGRASDVVIGQVQSYMGYIKEELAEKGQKVCGLIIAHEDDIRLHRALSVTQNIDFYTYKISFKLIKG
ncbi:MAG TPA: endonuclease NucS domain-containing protein [Patescibacteria group bacterium]|nr:endonuclease NucS domain-containing protein [Patescibacteria group bacterium]